MYQNRQYRNVTMVIIMIKENKPNIARTISWILVLIWMSVIFMFSSQDVEASSQSSGVISEAIYEVIEDSFPDSPITEDTFEFTLRNAAHFILYFVLGIFILNALYFYKIKWISLIGFSLLIAVLYALTDELHQYYVPGRAFQVNDLIIDTLGAMTGILIVAFLYSKRGKTEEMKNSTITIE